MNSPDATPPAPRRPGWPAIIALLVVAMVVSTVATLWVARTWLFPRPFEPVVLDVREQAALNTKLHSLAAEPPPGGPAARQGAPDSGRDGASPGKGPAPYVERPEDRVIYFTQRELNAMIARNPDLAERLSLHLSEGMLSATMLITLPHDLPVFAGHTVRVATGLRLRHEQGRPVLAIEGVSVMGVPLPAAWLGGLKGRDLFALYGTEGGFWQAFGEGVRDLRIESGRLRVELAE